MGAIERKITMEPKEIALIKRVQNQEPGAFEELYELYYPQVQRIAYAITKNDADTKDAVQETFIQIEKSISSLRDPEVFYGWMKKIVVSKCSRIFEKNRYHPMDPELIQKINKATEDRRYMIPKRKADYETDQDILYRMIEELKPHQKEVIYMMYFEQKKLHEISKELNVPLSTIKSRVSRARLDLEKKIKEFGLCEQRQLDFNVNTLLPITSLHTLFSWNVIQSKLSSIFVGNSVNVACVASLSVLTVTGGVFAYQDYQAAQHHQVMYQPPTEVLKEQDVQKPVSNQNVQVETEHNSVSFESIPYKDTNVENYMQAYFTCINWADTEEKMKTKTKEEFKEIEPIYHILKQEHGTYYEALNSLNWIDSYEKLASELM